MFVLQLLGLKTSIIEKSNKKSFSPRNLWMDTCEFFEFFISNEPKSGPYSQISL